MALSIEYRTCFGGVQLREVCGGDFVIVRIYVMKSHKSSLTITMI